MLIIIKEVNEKNDEIKIFFDSAYGSAHAYWDEDEKKPEINRQYNVEFGFPEGLRFGIEVIQSQEEKLQIYETNGKMVFCALLDDVEEDGFTSFRMDNSLLIANVEGKPFKNKTYVRVTPSKIILYDQHYY